MRPNTTFGDSLFNIIFLIYNTNSKISFISCYSLIIPSSGVVYLLEAPLLRIIRNNFQVCKYEFGNCPDEGFQLCIYLFVVQKIFASCHQWNLRHSDALLSNQSGPTTQLLVNASSTPTEDASALKIYFLPRPLVKTFVVANKTDHQEWINRFINHQKFPVCFVQRRITQFQVQIPQSLTASIRNASVIALLDVRNFKTSLASQILFKVLEGTSAQSILSLLYST